MKCTITEDPDDVFEMTLDGNDNRTDLFNRSSNAPGILKFNQ